MHLQFPPLPRRHHIRKGYDGIRRRDPFRSRVSRREGCASPTSKEAIELKAKTLIHEATHRYANTKDLGYFKDTGGVHEMLGLLEGEAGANSFRNGWKAVCAPS